MRLLRRGPSVVFGQVREDVALEASFAKGLALCIASGGDTAFALLVSGAERVIAVDINPAQVWLVELKIAIIRQASYREAVDAMVRDARPAFAGVRDRLTADAVAYFDAHSHDLARGLQNCGAVERRMPLLVRLLELFVVGRRNVDELLSLDNLEAQNDLFARRWNGWKWRQATSVAFSRLTFRIVLGSVFARAVPQGFARRFRDSMQQVLTQVPAASNPFLWQAFRHRYPDRVLPIWLTEGGFATLQQKLDDLTLITGDVAKVLENTDGDPFDLVCLSNILDGATPEYQQSLARDVVQACRGGGIVIRRSFFDSGVSLVEAFGEDLTMRPIPQWTDRSFFCRHVEIAEVRPK